MLEWGSFYYPKNSTLLTPLLNKRINSHHWEIFWGVAIVLLSVLLPTIWWCLTSQHTRENPLACLPSSVRKTIKFQINETRGTISRGDRVRVEKCDNWWWYPRRCCQWKKFLFDKLYTGRHSYVKRKREWI